MADVNIRINLITRQAEAQLKKFNTELSKAGAALPKVGNAGKRAGDKISKSFGRTNDIIKGIVSANLLFAFGRQIRRVVTDAVVAFAEFEQALAGVAKTTDLSGFELEQFGDEIKELATKIPVAQKELLRIAQIAGQLGVRGSRDLTKFTDTIAKLVVATDLTAENASLALSRILNITGEPIDNIDKLASAVVGLGNNFETLESELITITNQIARGTAGFGLASQEVFAIGTALKALGVQAESGGTAIGIVFSQIDKAIQLGGDRLLRFTKITGLTAKELKEEFARDSLSVFQKFIRGAGQDVSKLTVTLESLGLGQQRVKKALRPLILNYQKLDKTIIDSNKFFEENVELNREASRAFDTLKSSAIILANELRNVGIELVENLAPSIRVALDAWLAWIKATRTDDLEQLKVKVATATEAFELNARSLANAEREILKLRVQDRLLADGTSALTLQQGFFNKKLAERAELTKTLTEATAKLQLVTGVDIGVVQGPQQPTGGQIGAEQETQQEIFNVKQLFRDLDKEAEAQAVLDIETIKAVNGDIAFNNLSTRIGKERALEIATEAKRKLDLNSKIKDSIKREAGREKIIRSINKKIGTEEEKIDKKRKKDKKNLFENLTTISRLGGKKLFEATKKVQTGVAIIDGITAIQKALAVPPGFPLNIAGVAAATALAVANVSKIKSQSFQEGGIVGGSSFSGDSITARVNSGEMILNRQQQNELFQIAQGSQQQRENNEERITEVTVEIEGEAIAKAVSRQVSDGFILGENT